MIYYNQIFKQIDIGESLNGVVTKLRDDGLVDAILQAPQYRFQGCHYRPLKENGGKSHLHDKSSPQEIKEILGMSKQTFKKTIGMLYRRKKIIITKTGIHLKK